MNINKTDIIDKRNSGRTLQSIANEYGLTRERIRQILFDYKNRENKKEITKDKNKVYITKEMYEIIKKAKTESLEVLSTKVLGRQRQYLRNKIDRKQKISVSYIKLLEEYLKVKLIYE